MKPRSMEEKIGYRLFLMGFVGLLCTAALCIFVFHKAFRTQVWTAMEHEADLVSAGYRLSGDPRQLPPGDPAGHAKRGRARLPRFPDHRI